MTTVTRMATPKGHIPVTVDIFEACRGWRGGGDTIGGRSGEEGLANREPGSYLVPIYPCIRNPSIIFTNRYISRYHVELNGTKAMAVQVPALTMRFWF